MYVVVVVVGGAPIPLFAKLRLSSQRELFFLWTIGVLVLVLMIYLELF